MTDASGTFVGCSTADVLAREGDFVQVAKVMALGLDPATPVAT